MSVRKREWKTSKGVECAAWVVDYTDQRGARILKTFQRKKEADAYAATTHVNVRAGVHTSSKMTVAEAGTKWITDAEARLERATVESYQQHLDNHIIPYIGTVKLSDLTVPLIRDFMDKLRADKRSRATIKRVVGDLGSILVDAQERGELAQNVVRSLSHGKKRKAELRQKVKLKVGVDIPAPEEIRAFVAHLEGRWRPLLLTAIFTGLRSSELRGLQWPDLDLKKAELHVTRRADRFNNIGPPKSASGQRTIPLPPIVVNTLREWKLKCPQGELELVFPTGAGHIENHGNIVERGLQPTLVRAGVTVLDSKGKVEAKYTGLHALRHFYASWCINRKQDGGAELPIKTVQHRLGHSSIQMTADTYGHLFPSGDDAAELAAAEKALLG